jgi:hypothetical protein
MKSLHHAIPFLSLLSDRFNSSAPKLISWKAGFSKLDSFLCCTVEFFFITNYHGSHGKHRLLLYLIILSVFTDPSSSNRRPIVARVGSRGSVFTESLPSNGSIRHSMIKGNASILSRVTYVTCFCLLGNATNNSHVCEHRGLSLWGCDAVWFGM